MDKRWKLIKHDYDQVSSLASEISVTPLVAALLIARGYADAESARRFLSPTIEHLHDPFLLKGMPETVARIRTAIERGEKILIWGDYDVDGTTGTVLLRKALHKLGAKTDFHIPNRFTEGYGLNIDALEKAKNDGVALVVTVDCGTRSFDPIAWAAENGLDVIITDHHLSDPVRGLPVAVAVVNPNQSGCNYPDKELAGVGVALKLAFALLGETIDDKLLSEFLEIAAIGTVADVMKLTGENRSIVTLGLKQLSRTKNQGLRALMEISDCTSEMTSLHIGFRIAPRINAAGRMDVARHVVELLETENFSEARRLAGILDSRNRERQKMQQQITENAMFQAADFAGQKFIVVAGDNWHRGVIGLAASRLAERMYRPSIVLSVENGIAHGSARGIANFHLLNALEHCAEIFEQFGGHAAAAGMQIKTERIDELRSRLNNYAESALGDDDLIPELNIDALVTTQTLGLKMLEQVKCLEPFGAGNPKPIFVTKGLFVRDNPFVMKEKHLKILLADKDGKRFEAVWWDGVERSKKQTLRPGSSIELAYTAEANEWQGTTRLQLVVEDLKIDETSAGN
ncbi:MAG: single-stranded-DNA-specific exonuclease RecJ [Acidobacteria bacterium]|nr:single-stranded-DNA-specific exonuclease RecJ [Acidobacteriota bacterium]